MTMTLEELKRSVQSYRRQPPSWIEAIDAAIKERDELRSMHMQDCDELLHVPSQGEWRAMIRRAEAAESELAALKQRLTTLVESMERQADGNFNDRGNALLRYADEILECVKVRP